jgi:hypothetical protein
MERHTIQGHSGLRYVFDLIGSHYCPDDQAGLFAICRRLKDWSLETVGVGSTDNLRRSLVGGREETLRKYNADGVAGVEVGVLGAHWADQRAEMLADLR